MQCSSDRADDTYAVYMAKLCDFDYSFDIVILELRKKVCFDPNGISGFRLLAYGAQFRCRFGFSEVQVSSFKFVFIYF